ncbi:hypothetical protein HPC49_23385 [Pyxidicoccus fallax]|uniref:Lipoprotein n=1 Tax=Pyxidicoccus fallax TaxID=394095 RepID=A0A848LJI0_9BACT|nr:hypothetical protein [Pyxidicoccus fallax]NMO17870.1 hypothetical protein [Pyxidicoccus fallax]NPC81158.1 hypothetical protein [Pyxidicoccus fallax]
MNHFTRVVCLASAFVVAACGGPQDEQQEQGESLAQQTASLTTATSQGCDYSVASVQVTTAPPTYNIVVTRTGGATCTLATGVSQVIHTVPLDAPSHVAIVGSDQGLAVGLVMRNSWTGSSPKVYGLRHVNPTSLSTVRNADIFCDYMTGSISTGNLSLHSTGTGVSVSGSMACKMNGRQGTFYSASFANFFTSTTPPTITTF